MNNKLTKEQLLTALMIRLDQLESKIDKLLNSDLRIVSNITVTGSSDPNALIETIKNNIQAFNDKPSRCPNESYEDYLKRIVEYNTAQSDEEVFREECK